MKLICNRVKSFGKIYANNLKKRENKRGDRCHLEEQCILINVKRYWLWKAIDQEVYEVDVLV